MHNSIKPLNAPFNYITFNSQEATGRQDLKSYAKGITLTDIDAYIGILLHLSVTGGYERSIRDLWSQRIGDDFCQCTMSRSEFIAINTFIRYDVIL